MGLDNIPMEYPCVKQGVAIMTDDNRIHCDNTMNSGNCPWKTEYEKNYLVKDTQPTYGMFGTPCWYRGKYGNFLLSILEGNTSSWGNGHGEYSFYGDQDQGISVEYCLDMHQYMTDNAEEFASQLSEYQKTNEGGSINTEETIKDYIYATWWLKFAAKHCNGSKTWY